MSVGGRSVLDNLLTKSICSSVSGAVDIPCVFTIGPRVGCGCTEVVALTYATDELGGNGTRTACACPSMNEFKSNDPFTAGVRLARLADGKFCVGTRPGTDLGMERKSF
jgi:hypothetical protein